MINFAFTLRTANGRSYLGVILVQIEFPKLDYIARSSVMFPTHTCNETMHDVSAHQQSHCPVDWTCRIHRLHICRGVRPTNESPGYDIKQSDGKVSVMLELWGMQSTPSLPSLPGPLWSGVEAFDRVLSMGQIELNYVLFFKKLNCLK